MKADFGELIRGEIVAHERMLKQIGAEEIGAIGGIAEMIIDSIRAGGCIYICGNGGSAADAQHIAGELVGRFLRERRGLPAVALSTDTSVMTSIANDYDYESVFSRQVDALVKSGDVLWGISTSGNSSNVVAAAKLAKERGAKVAAFTGRKGCTLEKLADVCFCIEGSHSYLVQQVHQVAYHAICDLVERAFAGDCDAGK